MNEHGVLQNNDEGTEKKKVDESGSNGINSVDVEKLEKIYRKSAMCVCCEDFEPDSLLNFAKMLTPSFPVDVDKLERYCFELYEEEKAKMQEIMERFDGQVSLSVDIFKSNDDYSPYGWSDMRFKFGCYMSVTVHFIDENWKLRKYVLQFDRLEDLGSRDIILKCFQDFRIENKISAFMVHDTFDNTFVTLKNEQPQIIDILNSKTAGKEMPKISGPIFRVPCCASVLRIMVQEAFEEIEDILFKVNQLNYIGCSFPRWDIKLRKIEETLKMKAMGEYDSDDIKKDYKVPSDEEWQIVNDVCRLLGSIRKAAEVFYDTKNATASLYLYNLQKLRATLIKESVGSDQFISAVALDMLEKLYKYWKDSFMILAFATVLDPRCKLKFIEFALLKYEGDAAHSQIQLVRDAFHSLFNEYTTMYPLSGFEEVDSSSSDTDSEEEDTLTEKEKEIRDNPSFGFDSLDEYNDFLQSNSQPKRSELELYLEEQVLPWDRNINLLSYWQITSSKYPTLGRMARDILAIPLSLSNDFYAYFTDFRPAVTSAISLKPNLRNAVMCTRTWIEPKPIKPEQEDTIW